MKYIYTLLLVILFAACKERKRVAALQNTDSAKSSNADIKDSLLNWDTASSSITAQEVNTGNCYADTIVAFAESLKGVPYKYASTDPNVGFDCSGFITYVFTNFGINVPRSSKDFENVGTTVSLFAAKRGDLVLFTGTDSTDRTIGHMGIVTANTGGEIHFIHSTSGKAYGVTETLLNKDYMNRYVKTVRVFNQ